MNYGLCSKIVLKKNGRIQYSRIWRSMAQRTLEKKWRIKFNGCSVIVKETDLHSFAKGLILNFERK